MIKKVLVTGASGFVGSHICEVLHEAGYEVHALVRASSSRRWLDHPWLNIHSAELFDRRAVASILENVDAVVHNAGTLWGDYHRVNTEATRVMAEECIRAGVSKLVYVSSLAAGGPCAGPYPRDGNEPDVPISPYGHSKKDAEIVLQSLAFNINVLVLRFPMIFGPRDAQTLRLFRTFKMFINPSVGLRRRYISVIYVRDAARCVVAALQAGVPSGSVYNVSDGRSYTFNDLYKIVGKVWGRWALRIPLPFALLMFGSWLVNDLLKGKTAFNPDQIGMFRERYWLVSPDKAIRELDWRSATDIREGIRETIDWYKEHGWL